MATAYEPRTDLANRLLKRTERGPKVGFGSALFRRLGIADPFAGGDVVDRALTQPKFDFLSSRAYLAELRGLSRRRLMLLDRISSVRSALRSHQVFQQRIATPAVRAASLGLETSTLIDWSTQIEDDVEASDEDDGAAARALTGRRHAEEGGLRETAATRALKSEIAQASGVLAQLQRLLDVDRGASNHAAEKLATMGRQSPTERATSARRLARELRGVAAIARRGSELSARESAVGERPLAVAQARQTQDPAASKGLRRVLGESPVIMTLEEVEPVAAPDDARPPARRSARPAVEDAPRAARDPHAGRVARAATEARSQASVGRAGPPRDTATASPATRVAAAPLSNVRATARPTQRIAHAALAATNAPLNDVRRGLQAAQAPVARVSPLAQRSALAARTVDAIESVEETAARRAPRRIDAPTMVGIEHEAEEGPLDENATETMAGATPAAAPNEGPAPARRAAVAVRPEPQASNSVQGIARIAARSEAGSADSRGRVTGATRYLAPEPTVAPSQNRSVVQHEDGRFRSFDVTAPEGATASEARGTTRPMGIARTAPVMAVPEADATEIEAEEAPIQHVSSAEPPVAAARRASTPASTARPAAQPSTPRHVEAPQSRGTSLPPVARAMQRAVPAATERAIAVSRPAVVPTRIERSHTDVVAGVRSAPSVRTASAMASSAGQESSRGSLQAAVQAPADAPRAAASTTTGIRRRSRALPTVRAAARTLSQERWGARGRMLSPSVSRFVDATTYEQTLDPQAGGSVRTPQGVEALRGDVRVSTLTSNLGERVFATNDDQALEDEGVVSADQRGARADGGTPQSPRSVSAPSGVTPQSTRPASASPDVVSRQVPERTLGPVARAAERSSEHPRSSDGRTLASPRVITPFQAPATLAERVVARQERAPTTAGEQGSLSDARDAVVASSDPERAQVATRTPKSRTAPELVLAAEAADETTTAPVAGSVERASRRGSEVVPAARRTVLPAATPEQQTSEARRVVARTERRLEAAGEPSPFRAPARSSQVRAPLDPVLVHSVTDDSPPVAVADAVVRANARSERGPSASAGARRIEGGSVPGIGSFTPVLPSLGSALEASEPVVVADGSAAPTHAVESAVARAGRRSESTRTSLAASPVTSARSFADEVSSVVAPRRMPLAPDAVFADQALPDVPTVASGAPEAPRSERAHTGTRRAASTQRRAPSTVRALGRSRARRDLRSVVPHPVGTQRTARASARLLDRAAGAIAAPEAVLVRPDEVVDLASGPTSPADRTLGVGRPSRMQSVLDQDGDVQGYAPAGAPEGPSIVEQLAERGERGITRDARPTHAALVDGMTLAESWSDDLPRTDESVAGGRRAVGRLPGQDRSRFAPDTPSRGQVVRSALDDVLQNASVLRAAERGDDPVVSVPGVRRAAGLRDDRSTRFEARIRATGSGVETVVVDTLTGQTLRTAGPAMTGLELDTAGTDTELAARPTALQRAEQREGSVQTVDGRERASMRGAAIPPTVIARAQPELQEEAPGRAPLSQTFTDLLDGASSAVEGRPLMRRRTWNRRQLAHELGEFAPAMAEAEFLEAPAASDDAPAWARRAVTGTGAQRPQTRGPAARAELGARRGLPEGVTVENGEARAFEPNSLVGALSRADGPEELIKVIVERRTEVKTIRETLPAEAVRLVERLSTLSPEEAAVLQGSRTLQAQPRTNLAGPRRGGASGGFTQLSSANDGHGANQVMKLADKLRNLIHLAENQRLADAHRQLQMSQAAAKAESSAFQDPRGPGQSPDAQTMNMQKLQDDVWQSLQKQFEKLKTQMGDL